MEIAQEMGHLHLTEILALIIHHPVPYSTLTGLTGLQASFHEMIRTDVNDVPNLVLPELVALTEVRMPEMWFPLRQESEKEHAVVSSLSSGCEQLIVLIQ